MKKLIFVIFVFWLLPVMLIFPANGNASEDGRFYFALGLGYQFKGDDYFKLVYGSGAANYTADLGYWVFKKAALGIKLSYLSQKGETLLFKSETRLRQIPVIGYLKTGLAIGKKLTGYVSLGLGVLFFKEESYMGKIEGNHFGWELEAGLEYSFAKNLYFLLAARYQSFKYTFTELNETQQLGGTEIRLGPGIRF